jgi:CheY-like chemotaxis protein
VASTLLAVDDSVTMRKVLEITFTGPDFRVVTANSPDAALQKLKSDKPDVVISDLSLDPINGYDLCKAIKKAAPGTPVLLLSSKQNAFDAAKGTAAQADDHMDKPFDTQQMIDKVKKLLAAGAGAQPAAAQPTAKSPKETTPSMAAVGTSPAKTTASGTGAGALPPAAAAAAAQAQAAAPTTGGAPPQRAKTLIYNPPAQGGPVAAPARTPAGPTPVSGLPTTQAATARPNPATTTAVSTPSHPPSHAPEPHTTPAAQHPATAHVNGQMAAKLEGLGLTPAQVDAVLALSREVVERVVWEVVPVLAETLIKEELARLTK